VKKIDPIKYNTLQRSREYSKQRRENPEYKLIQNMTSRIYKLTSNKSINKCATTLKLLDCNSIFFIRWISYQFENWMNFDNYGSLWEIDHVTPCVSFDLTKDDEQKRCFNWTNCRPLSDEENESKGDEVIISVINNHNKIVEQYKQILKIKENCMQQIQNAGNS